MILSSYNVINLTVITVGQMMLTLYDPSKFPLFALTSVLISMAVLPLAMTTAVQPSPVENVRLRLNYLYGVSPVGCIGAFVVGLANGAFWTLAPVFAKRLDFDTTGVAVFMSAAVAAGAIGQWPLGRLSDTRDRRQVVLAACIIGAASGLAMSLVGGSGTWFTFVLVFAFGSTAFPLYSICVAHLNDFIGRDEFVEASSAILLLYAIGAAIGPIPASLFMQHLTAPGLFVFTALAHGSFAVFVVVRMNRRTAPPETEKEAFVVAPNTSPTRLALDPRGTAEEDLNGTAFTEAE